VKDRIIAIVLAFVTFVLLATFPGWHVETNQEGSDVDVKPFPKRAVSQAALAFVFIAAVFVLVRLPISLLPASFTLFPSLSFSLRQCFMLTYFTHQVSVLWQHTASVAAAQIARDFGNGSVMSGVGSTAMILGWFGFALLVIVTIGLVVMILTVRLLNDLAA